MRVSMHLHYGLPRRKRLNWVHRLWRDFQSLDASLLDYGVLFRQGLNISIILSLAVRPEC